MADDQHDTTSAIAREHPLAGAFGAHDEKVNDPINHIRDQLSTSLLDTDDVSFLLGSIAA